LPLLCAGILLFAAGLCRADVEARIEHCAARPTPAERIACLEENLRELGGAARTPMPLPSNTASAPAPLPEHATPTDAPSPQADTPRADTTPAPSGPDAAPDAQEPRAGAAVELGAEQVAARERARPAEAAPVRATVTEFRFFGYRRLMVRLDNGQVWQQIDGDRTSVERGLRDSGSFDVEMWPTRLGGYRMRILPLDRTIRVERVR
jgi:hypothetical protein